LVLTEEIGHLLDVVSVLLEHGQVLVKANEAEFKKFIQGFLSESVLNSLAVVFVDHLGCDDCWIRSKGFSFNRDFLLLNRQFIDRGISLLVTHRVKGFLGLKLSHRLDQDIDPDFVAKAVVVACDHSEEGSVGTFSFRSVKLNLPVIFLTRLDFFSKANRLTLDLVASNLTEQSIFRPRGIPIVAEGPDLCVLLSSGHRVSVAEVLLDEPALVLDHLV